MNSLKNLNIALKSWFYVKSLGFLKKTNGFQWFHPTLTLNLTLTVNPNPNPNPNPKPNPKPNFKPCLNPYSQHPKSQTLNLKP